MRTDDFDYALPPELIAQEPAARRDQSRLLVVDRATGTFSHRRFADLVEYLAPGDLLVVNDSRVLPARLRGVRIPGGGAVELLLLREEAPDTWVALARPARRVRVGDALSFDGGALSAAVREARDDGQRVISFAAVGEPVAAALQRAGEVPLPPYIQQKPRDPERYQTVYAHAPGSVAAPTAGLHFTSELLDRLRGGGVGVASVTLHVGLGTFRPVQADRIEEHRMHAEYGVLPAETAAALRETRARGGRIVAVGTTAVRVLESAARRGFGEPWSGWTDIFIYPGFVFGSTDVLITNFHLPRSTLLMLVSALAGKGLVDRAYAVAVAERYRFFSFGDAMLVL